MDTKRMRACASMLPEPGGAVVLQCLDEIDRLRQALSDIANPFDLWNRELKEGERLNGAMCVYMANDTETYKSMAREALNT